MAIINIEILRCNESNRHADTVIKISRGLREKIMIKNVKIIFYMLLEKTKIKLNFMKKTGFKKLFSFFSIFPEKKGCIKVSILALMLCFCRSYATSW